MFASLDTVRGELAARGSDTRKRRGRLGRTGRCDGLIDGLANGHGGDRGSQGSNSCRWAGMLDGRGVFAGYRKRLDWARDAAGGGDGNRGRNARGCSGGWHGYRCIVESEQDRTVSACRRHCVSVVDVDDVCKKRSMERRINKQTEGGYLYPRAQIIRTTAVPSGLRFPGPPVLKGRDINRSTSISTEEQDWWFKYDGSSTLDVLQRSL